GGAPARANRCQDLASAAAPSPESPAKAGEPMSTPRVPLRAGSGGLHAVAALRCGCFRCCEEGKQRRGIRRTARRPAYGRREDGRKLDFRRQQADDVDARHVHQFAQLLEAELDIAARHERPHRDTWRSLHDPRRDRVGDAPALEQAGKVFTARARRVPDTADAEDRVADRWLGRDVGPRRAGGDRYRHRGTGEIGPTRRIDAAAAGQLVDRRGGQHDKVEGFSLVDAADGIHAADRNNSDRLPRLPLVSSAQLGQHVAHRHRCDARDAVGPARLDAHVATGDQSMYFNPLFCSGSRMPYMSRPRTPAASFARLSPSFASRAAAASSAFGASAAGTTTTPSSSATMTSPGVTRAPAHTTGMFTDPSVALTVPLAEIALLQTGNRISVRTRTSRTPASMTRPLARRVT